MFDVYSDKIKCVEINVKEMVYLKPLPNNI